MAEAKHGDTVRVHYTGKLEDGTVFDSSGDRGPMEFTIGKGQIIPGFEEAVVGMSPGESKTATIPVDKAYGPHREEMVVTVDRKEFPEDVKPEINQQLQLRLTDGRTIVVMVTDISELSVTIDANHPLAGKDLTFEIQLTEIV
ncbi:MAG: peptidylprolyl isomerase [Deltaproteobacteria bacterium]|nr:peptidylprolyl isomerase [Deltaproteobacteria bacterium]MBW2074186.1 peptidylprolyl isomerase [Deltaproteobacteria bacterium]RLB83992.1 MAG: peptidylprolyl isomerase [Deltaproteobacteria bacterium]